MHVADPEPLYPVSQAKLYVAPDAVPAPPAIPFAVLKSLAQGLGSHVGESQTPAVHVADPDPLYPVSQKNKQVSPDAVPSHPPAAKLECATVSAALQGMESQASTWPAAQDTSHVP
mgnify:CR=1 FL=1